MVSLNQYSHIGEKPDHAVAEFCVLPKYRNAHVARQTVEILYKNCPGKWEIKYCSRNIPASRLWNQTAKSYHPIMHRLTEDETVLSFETKQE